MLYLPLLLRLHGLATAGEASLTTLGDDHLRAALGALIALAHLIGHFRSASVAICKATLLIESPPFPASV